MQSKIYKNFEIFENGEIWLIKDGCKRKLNQYSVSRNRKYLIVVVSENGKQKQYYVHRLVASAFIPNPENKPQVNHIDGNPSNNNISNLEWVTGKENVLHSYENIRPKYPCIFCGSKTFSSRAICHNCLCRERERKKYKIKKDNRLNEFKKSINVSALNERQKMYFDLYLKGLSYTEIGKEFGITRQAVAAQFAAMKKKTKL